MSARGWAKGQGYLTPNSWLIQFNLLWHNLRQSIYLTKLLIESSLKSHSLNSDKYELYFKLRSISPNWRSQFSKDFRASPRFFPNSHFSCFAPANTGKCSKQIAEYHGTLQRRKVSNFRFSSRKNISFRLKTTRISTLIVGRKRWRFNCTFLFGVHIPFFVNQNVQWIICQLSTIFLSFQF